MATCQNKGEDEELSETPASGRKEYPVPSPLKWEWGASISYPIIHHPLPNHLQTHSSFLQHDTAREEILDDKIILMNQCRKLLQTGSSAARAIMAHPHKRSLSGCQTTCHGQHCLSHSPGAEASPPCPAGCTPSPEANFTDQQKRLLLWS